MIVILTVSHLVTTQITVMVTLQGLAVMMFSVDIETSKVLVYAGVPDEVARKGLVLIDWLQKALEPINGKGGGKGGLAQGQVSLTHVQYMVNWAQYIYHSLFQYDCRGLMQQVLRRP